jgi:hypothetical protein
MPLERRKHIRKPTYLGGRIAFNHLYATMDCLVRNMSPAGARLIFNAPVVLPANFVLSIPSREQAINARIAWRNEKEVGVTFEVSAPAREVASLEMARKIRRLEEEKATLTRKVEELSGAS